MSKKCALDSHAQELLFSVLMQINGDKSRIPEVVKSVLGTIHCDQARRIYLQNELTRRAKRHEGLLRDNPTVVAGSFDHQRRLQSGMVDP